MAAGISGRFWRFCGVLFRAGPRPTFRLVMQKAMRRLLVYTGYEIATLEQRVETRAAARAVLLQDRLSALEQEFGQRLAAQAAMFERQRAAWRAAAAAEAARAAARAHSRSESRERQDARIRQVEQDNAALHVEHRHATQREIEHADSIRRLAILLSAAAGSAEKFSGMPMISVIMPVHNRAALIARSVQSVLAQTGARFELIVIDDGSTDDLSVAVDRSAPGMRLLRVARQGAPAARNRGIEAACGEIIAYLDSDNIMLPGYLAALAAAYAANAEAGCAHAALLWDGGGTSIHLRHDIFDWQALLRQTVNLDMNCFSHRKSLWERLGGFDETLTKHADFDLALRYTRACKPLRIDAIAAHYDSGHGLGRLSDTAASGPNIARIEAKFRAMTETPLRVLICCYDYPQLSESYIDTEIDFLLRAGHAVEVFSLAIPGAPGRAQVPVWTRQLAAAVAGFRPDVIHCHWLPTANAAVGIAEAAGIPITVRGHGFEFSDAAALACAAHAAVRAVYLFPHLAAGLAAQSPKIKAMPACFNNARFYPRLNRDPRLVLRAAAGLNTKDIELFIRVAARLPEFRFVLALARIASLPDLPAHFLALNASLGDPVEILFDVPYKKMARLTAEAAIYLHTLSACQVFGMPVSVAEALACGALVIAPDNAAARSYAGPQALFYETEDQAIGHIRETLRWTAAQWSGHARAAADFAYAHYADTAVLPMMVDDWHAILADQSLKPAPATLATNCRRSA